MRAYSLALCVAFVGERRCKKNHDAGFVRSGDSLWADRYSQFVGHIMTYDIGGENR
jgi:hypothetical protein